MPYRAIIVPSQVSDTITRLHKLVCIVGDLIDDSTKDMPMFSITAVTAAGHAMSRCLLLSYCATVWQCITLHDGVT